MKILKWCDESPFKTVCHGDSRLDNFYFQEHEDGSLTGGMYDWALSLRAPCYYDVSWMLTHSFPCDFQTEYEGEFLALYWKTLKENLPKDCHMSNQLLFGDFRVGYGLGQLICLSKCVMAYEAITKMDKNSDEYKEKLR